MKGEIRPKLISGIKQWQLFPEMLIFGNRELDRYLRVPARSAEPVWRALQYLDGSRTIGEVADLVHADGWNLDVVDLYCKLKDAGLVEGTAYLSDVDRVSVTWLEARVARLFPIGMWWRYLAWAAMAFSVVLIIGTACIWLTLPEKPVPVWIPSDRGLVFAMSMGALISIAVHEAGHALAACSEGLIPGRISVLGYLGVIPYILLRIPGLYTIPPIGRVRVWLAGPLASLSLASFCYLGSGIEGLPLPARVWMDHMSTVNAMIAFWNCCPLLPTDGYFVACTLLRQANWRIRSWREVASCLRHRHRPQALLLVYGVLSCAGLALLTMHSIHRILALTNFSWFGYAVILMLILLFIYKRSIVKRQRAMASIGGKYCAE